jgi:hypothetical protein
MKNSKRKGSFAKALKLLCLIVMVTTFILSGNSLVYGQNKKESKECKVDEKTGHCDGDCAVPMYDDPEGKKPNEVAHCTLVEARGKAKECHCIRFETNIGTCKGKGKDCKGDCPAKYFRDKSGKMKKVTGDCVEWTGGDWKDSCGCLYYVKQ